MRIKCPNCGKEFGVPPEYEGKKTKCTCRFVFIAHDAAKINCDPLPKITEKRSNPQKHILTKIWNNSPIAFRTAFLATLGVVSALVVTYFCLDWANTLKKFPSKSRESSFKNNSFVSTNSQEICNSSWSSKDVYSITWLYFYAGQFETIVQTRCAICETIPENPQLYRSYPKVFEAILNKLQTITIALAQLNLSQNNEKFENTKSLYIEAMKCELDVINELIRATKNVEFSPQWEQIVKKANDSGQEAMLQLASLLFTLDPNMGKTIQELKK